MFHRFSYFALLLVVSLLIGCQASEPRLDIAGMFHSSSPHADKRFADSEAYNRQHGIDTLQAQSEEYRVYACTDTHVSTTRRNWVQYITTYRSDMNCPVALHLGDLIDSKNHYPYMYQALDSVPRNPSKHDTILTMPGNHDLYYHEWADYQRYFFTSSYYFLVRTPSGQLDFFLIMDSAEGCLGQKQLAWVRQILAWAKQQPFRHRIVASHTHPFMEDYSQELTSCLPLEETYELMNLFGGNGVEFYLSGHDHYRSVTHFDGCTYIVADSMGDKDAHAAYLVLTMSDKIQYDFVPIVGK